MNNPYPKTIIDEVSGVEVSCDAHRHWQEGFEAGRLEGFAIGLAMQVADVSLLSDAELSEINKRAEEYLNEVRKAERERIFLKLEEHAGLDCRGNFTITIGYNHGGNQYYYDWWQALKGEANGDETRGQRGS